MEPRNYAWKQPYPTMWVVRYSITDLIEARLEAMGDDFPDAAAVIKRIKEM